MSDVADVLAELTALFKAGGTPWYVFGAQAVMVHGRPRMTADIGVTIQATIDQVGGLTDDLERRGFTIRVPDPATFVQRTRVLPVTHETTGIPVDLVLAGPGLEQEFLQRAVNISVEDIAVPFISPEDLIITKILAGRPKDLDDVRGILAKQGPALDTDRILNVLSQIEQALDVSDLVSTFRLQGLN